MKTTPPTLKMIGIAGTNGSGKDTIGQILASRHNFLFVSLTDILRAELKRQNMAPNRENARNLSSKWRSEFGLGVLIDRARQQYILSPEKYDGLAMASLRNPGEVDEVHKFSGLVIWVDAEPRLRYDRLIANSHLRGADRHHDDNKSFEEFLAEEAAEMHRPIGGDQTTLSGSEVKAKSDLFIINDGNDLEVLSQEVSKLLGF